jgi:hypothetical protein
MRTTIAPVISPYFRVQEQITWASLLRATIVV